MGGSSFVRAATSLILAVVVSLSIVTFAAERATEYEYDEAGRLRKAISPENEVSYALDAAGNRTSLTSATGRGWPASIMVPPSSITGTYNVEWGAPTGSGNRYELYEAGNSGFSGEVKVYDGPGHVAEFTAKPDGTYYYRVRACDGTGCGPRLAGANPISVARPPVPGQPGAMMIPTGDIDGSYEISWGSSTGTVTAYELYEAVNGGPFGSTPAYSGTSTTPTLSGRGNGTYSYRVRACNTPVSCSSYQTGANSVSVTLPPSTPGAVVVPAYNNTGNYTVSWGASTGVVTAYEVLEWGIPGESLVYSGMATSLARSGKPDDVYTYRVRACNGTACSGYTSAQGMAPTVYVDKIAPTPPASVNMTGTGYNLYWTGGSQDSAGAGAGSGVGSWNVYRNGSYIGTSTLPNQGFQDASLPGNITLNYVVRSVDRAGNESGPSPTYTTYVDTIPPTTPGNLQATSVTVNSVSLAWNASTDANGISWYKVVRTPGTVVTGPLHPSTSWVDETVASNTAYTFQVYAVDNYGVESAPASINVTTPAGAPSVPTMNGSAVVQDTDGVYTISWQASTGSVAHYVLDEEVGGSGVWNPITVTGTSRSFTQGGGEYRYRVKACTSGGVCSGYSSNKLIVVCIGGCP